MYYSDRGRNSRALRRNKRHVTPLPKVRAYRGAAAVTHSHEDHYLVGGEFYAGEATLTSDAFMAQVTEEGAAEAVRTVD